MRLFILSVVSFALFLPLGAFAGNEGGHGGDPFALEFIALGKLVARELRTESDLSSYHFTADLFANAVSHVRLVSDKAEKVVLDGAEVGAINYPAKNLILLNSDRWLESSIERRIQLVIHEYFGIMGVERDHYDVSTRLLEFTRRLVKKIKTDQQLSSLMVNLFYGQCRAFAGFSDSEICDNESQAMIKAQDCARVRAQGQCQISGKTHCELVATTYTPVVSQETIGVRYCEILTIMK